MTKAEKEAAKLAAKAEKEAAKEAEKANEEEKEEEVKPTVVSFVGPGINHEPFSPGGKTEIMFNNLCAQSKRPLFIPLLGGEKLGAIANICLNGLRINILKGQYVDVPQQVAEIMMDSLNQTVMASENATVYDKTTGQTRPARLDLQDEAARNRLNA